MNEPYKSEYTFDPDGNMIIKRTTVLDGHFDACHAFRTMTPEFGKFKQDKTTHFVASIPADLAFEWMKEGLNIFNMNDPSNVKKLKAKLNGEFSKLKTINAKL